MPLMIGCCVFVDLMRFTTCCLYLTMCLGEQQGPKGAQQTNATLTLSVTPTGKPLPKNWIQSWHMLDTVPVLDTLGTEPVLGQMLPGCSVSTILSVATSGRPY